jgi:hypothetical protein
MRPLARHIRTGLDATQKAYGFAFGQRDADIVTSAGHLNSVTISV